MFLRQAGIDQFHPVGQRKSAARPIASAQRSRRWLHRCSLKKNRKIMDETSPKSLWNAETYVGLKMGSIPPQLWHFVQKMTSQTHGIWPKFSDKPITSSFLMVKSLFLMVKSPYFFFTSTCLWPLPPSHFGAKSPGGYSPGGYRNQRFLRVSPLSFFRSHPPNGKRWRLVDRRGNLCMCMWRFPEIGVPLNHPF